MHAVSKQDCFSSRELVPTKPVVIKESYNFKSQRQVDDSFFLSQEKSVLHFVITKKAILGYSKIVN